VLVDHDGGVWWTKKVSAEVSSIRVGSENETGYVQRSEDGIEGGDYDWAWWNRLKGDAHTDWRELDKEYAYVWFSWMISRKKAMG
jgi:hypothetical protein